jgi:hypothetical protein
MLRDRRVAKLVSRGKTCEKAGTNNTSSKVSALPRRRMGEAPDAKSDYTEASSRDGLQGSGAHPRTTLSAMRLPRLVSLRPHVAASALIVGLALLLVAAQAHAQWKWRDQKGQVHVSDLPPPREVPDKDVLQRPTAPARTIVTSQAAASAASAAAPIVVAKPQAETELDKRRKAAEQEQQAKNKVEEERVAGQRRENCARARGHASALESGQRIARTNEKGEREILDDKGRADELRRTREIIATDCR